MLSAALYLRPGAASRRRATSSWLSTTGALRGLFTVVRGRTRSGRSSVTLKKSGAASHLNKVRAISQKPSARGVQGNSDRGEAAPSGDVRNQRRIHEQLRVRDDESADGTAGRVGKGALDFGGALHRDRRE